MNKVEFLAFLNDDVYCTASLKSLDRKSIEMLGRSLADRPSDRFVECRLRYGKYESSFEIDTKYTKDALDWAVALAYGMHESMARWLYS